MEPIIRLTIFFAPAAPFGSSAGLIFDQVPGLLLQLDLWDAVRVGRRHPLD